MAPNATSRPNIESFVSTRFGILRKPTDLQIQSLLGGLVSPSVQHVRFRFVDDAGENNLLGFVVKELRGPAIREAMVYEKLLPHGLGLAPALLAIERYADRTYLYLEAVESEPDWPWCETSLAMRVMEKLSILHQSASSPEAVEGSEFESELETTAAATLVLASDFARATGDPRVRVALPSLTRLVRHLPESRRWLIDAGPLPATVIHGDVHPGNVVIRRGNDSAEPLLIDWARARHGSPLEDVSSFIQWLAFWEYNAMRRHDSLLGAYLSARGMPTPPSMTIRDAYWLAGAINACSGALIYHLSVAMNPEVSARERDTSIRAVHHCSRIIRRADRGQFLSSLVRVGS